MAEILSREVWKKVTDMTLSMMKGKGLDYEFNPPKNDGSYVKTKSASGICFTFALNKREVWIELSIKAKNGQRQEPVYNYIRSNALEIRKKLGHEIRWDKEDIVISNRRTSGGDYRIKTIMPFALNEIRFGDTNLVKSWAERMVQFIEAFSPFIPGKASSGFMKKTVTTFREAHLPDKGHVELAESQLRKTLDEKIGLQAVLAQIELNFNKEGKQLKDNWREITRRNIILWFGKEKQEA